jgi:hypothetical protein
MPIAIEDGFYRAHDLSHVSCLGMETKRAADCIRKIRDERIAGVFANPTFGFDGKDLDFLNEIPWIESIWFWDVALDNIDGLYALENLRSFGVHPKRPPVDFSCFPKLRKAVIEPKTRDRGLDALTELELLHVWHYRPANGSFASLKLPASITELQINWANAVSLDSLPALPYLRCLEIHRCRNLENLGLLREKFPCLEHLLVSACGKVTSSEGKRSIEGLDKLSHAVIGKVKIL